MTEQHSVPEQQHAVRDVYGRPLEDLRISVIDRCNFRCTFCMPAGQSYDFLPKNEILSFEEITRLARIFVGLGVRKLRLTGGEPLLRTEIERLVEMLAGIPEVEDLALTTNGLLLAEKAETLRSAGLRRVTVSLPSLDDRVFARLNGLGHRVKDVLAGIEAAAEAGLEPVKINVVVIKDVNDEEVPRLARFFKQRGHEVRFIEYMDVGTLNRWDPGGVVPAREIVERVGREMPLVPLGRDRPSDVANRFRHVDDDVRVGIIASITEPFCGDCSRGRLSADGHFFTCLFASAGHDLKGPLRGGLSDRELAERIVQLWGRRRDRYSEERAAAEASASHAETRSNRRVEMFRIGG